MTKTINLIKNSDELVFIVGGIGNVLNEKNGSTSGIRFHAFNRVGGKMTTLDDDTAQRFGVKRAFEPRLNQYGDNSYQERYFSNKKDNHFYVMVALPFSSVKDVEKNTFANDSRLGVHVTLGIGFDEPFVLEDKEIEKKIKEFSDKSFFSLLFRRCAEEFIPDYYRFVLENREYWKTQGFKLI